MTDEQKRIRSKKFKDIHQQPTVVAKHSLAAKQYWQQLTDTQREELRVKNSLTQRRQDVILQKKNTLKMTDKFLFNYPNINKI